MADNQQRRRIVDAKLLEPELDFTASRSDGPGGQHVNKVSSRITVRFDLHSSVILDGDEKALLQKKLGKRLTKDGELILSEQGSRSQLQNKQGVREKLDALLAEAFKPERPRKKTKPSKSSVEKRIKQKRQQSEKKRWRQGRDR